MTLTAASSNVLEAARKYAAAKFRVVPLDAGTKRPARKGFEADDPDYSCPPEDFRPDELVGILCGSCPALGSSWLLGLDCDGTFDRADLERRLGPLPHTLTSHGGRHLFFAVPPSEKRSRLKQWNDVFKTKAETGGALDLRWAGGQMREIGDWESPGFDPNLIAELPEQALNALLASPRAAKATEATPSPEIDGGADWLRSIGLDHDEVKRWAFDYISEEALPCIEGQGGDTQLLVVAGALLVGYGLDYDTAHELLVAYNEDRCEPPWDIGRIDYKLQQVLECGSTSFYPAELARRDQFVAHLESYEGPTIAKNDNASEPAAAPHAPPAPPAWRLLGDADLLAELGPVDWLCQGLELAPGAPSIWAGYGFSGKTFAAQDLAVAVATGASLWGMPVRKGRVVHLDFEQGRRLTAARYQKLLRGRGLLDFAGNLEVGVFPPFRLGAATEKQLTEMCAGRALCVIDSLRAAAPGDLEENSSEFRAPLDMLARISETTGCAFVVIHHARKPAKDNAGGAKMSLRGSGAIFDACAAVLVFSGEKDRPTKVSMEKARITGECRADFELLREDVETEQGPGLRMRIVGHDEQAEVSAEMTQIETHVIETVRRNPGCSKNLVFTAVGGKRNTVMATLEQLEQSGRIWNAGSASGKCLLFAQDPLEIVRALLLAAKPEALTVASLVRESRLPLTRVKSSLSLLQEQRQVFAGMGTGDDQRWASFE